MKPQRLKCIRCGRKAHLLLHGSSYCQLCGKKAANRNQIDILPTSPLVRKIPGEKGVTVFSRI